MTRFHVNPVKIAIAASLVFSMSMPIASAQKAEPKQDDGTMSMHEKRAQRLAQIRGETGGEKTKNDAKEQPKEVRYPKATRLSPEAKATGKMLKQLQSLQEMFEKRDMAGVIAKADEIAAMPDAGNYDKSFAYSLAANAAADQNDDAKAAAYFKKALDSNGLDNDSHYTTMFNLAVSQYQQEKFQEALSTLDRFLAETKSEQPEQLSLRAGLLANLGRNEEAAAAYKSLIAKNPTDKRLVMNAVATLQAADKFDQANILLEDAYKRGMLTDAKELRTLYVGYINARRWNDAKAVMEAGTSKGLLEGNPQLAKDYMVLAQSAYADDKVPLAIEMYTKAGPIAEDGEAYLNLAKVLQNSGKKADAKAAAQKALDKGLKKPDEAKRILSS
ncbi:MAG: tetratricopeptide repeat protein [Thermomonas sp.]